MATVAEVNTEHCVAVHSLLFAYESLGSGSDEWTRRINAIILVLPPDVT